MTERFRVSRQAIGYLAPALDVLHDACDALGIAFFIMGAAARDLLLEYVYGVQSLRATKDVDVAIAVQGWEDYETLIERLCHKHSFARDREPHRLRREDLMLDVIPFGPIATDQNQVVWPQETTALSVLGYQEVFDASVHLVIGDAPTVRIASLPGIGILKLIAWSESPHQRPQDPIDLCTIMMAYQEVVGERLFTEHADLLEDDSFDVRVAAAQIYGRDMASLLHQVRLKERILAILHQHTVDENDSKLTQAMGTACHFDYAFRFRCLQALIQGILDSLR